MEKIEVSHLVELLRADNPRASVGDLRMYADMFHAYAEAQTNIQECGNVVIHPRTGAPVENPYLKIRDKAGSTLRKINLDKTETVWKLLP